MTNVAIALAGAAADARTMGRNQEEAFANQPSDVKWATGEIEKSGLLSPADDGGAEEREIILSVGYKSAEKLLSKPEIWAVVEELAERCLAGDGKLSKEEIEEIVPATW